jgi:hypothetical protein
VIVGSGVLALVGVAYLAIRRPLRGAALAGEQSPVGAEGRAGR